MWRSSFQRNCIVSKQSGCIGPKFMERRGEKNHQALLSWVAKSNTWGVERR